MSARPFAETIGMPAPVFSISFSTRCGYFTAKKPDTQPPSDSPDRCARSIPIASISSRSCSASTGGVYSIAMRLESAWPT